ncbi:IPT/TIG domain-containing protein [Neorhizobium sp. JUb45]|uniref:IPT/TIG domain-containing protein n=1 Tax=Neorhizobium sp. JUb45 TaxID=2485113 RepID=UPI00104C496E|nr:IPT/TIG domain-containing protein [Neorhizobium sp. JUb45]TCR03934.1 outer membrane autotransporter protein [Neorhizobium sp. JUb45]
MPICARSGPVRFPSSRFSGRHRLHAIIRQLASAAYLLILCSIFLLQAAAAQAAPTITLVSPNTGSTAGGSIVTITGTEFTGTTVVRFGLSAATAVTVVNATTITARTPFRLTAGLVDVTVVAPTGTIVATNAFTYVPEAPPTVLLVAPLTGSTAGGTSVTITGTNFTGATAVSFGGVAATNVTVVNGLTITATTPAHVAGLVGVSVTTPAGTGSGLGLFTYVQPPPLVVLATPLIGSTAGGTPVTITGVNFTGATAVSFGGVAATGVTVVNDLTITAIAPAHAAGLVNVAVTTASGTGSGIGLFTYVQAPPVVVLATPLTGSTSGGTSVTITGVNFTGATGVTFGGTAATGITVVNDTTITATAPAHAAGLVDVTVTNAGGTGIGLGLFTYLPSLPPSVLLVAPLTGSINGGTAVTITGANFTGATAVRFGGTAATGVTVLNDTTITATAPAHAAGLVDVSVTASAGTGIGLGVFTYLPTAPPSVLLATPLTGPISGGTVVTITGVNFTGATAVRFGGTLATAVTVINDTTITATAPAHAAGLVDVSVTSATGTGLGLGLFTYLPTAVPSVLLAAPLTGPAAGGTPVTITGLNFTGATAVRFGGTLATAVTVVNDTTITATAPAHAAGLVDVTVTSPAGTGLGLGLYTYLPALPPTGIAVLPLTGPTSGGTPVTITGVNFTGVTGVSFGGTAATSVTVVNDTTITATTPAHAAGIVNVSLTSPAGTGTGVSLFTYLPVAQPSVLLVAPLTGPISGNTTVTITGLNFTGATAVSFGGTAATGVTVVNDNTITAITPAHAAGIVDVSVTSGAGTGLGLGLFTYLPTIPPSTLAVLPLTGSTAGGTPVTITGLNFTGANAVSFGGTPATNFQVVNNSTITATAPAHAAGLVDVNVTSGQGTGVGTGLFTYLPTAAPSVLLVGPLTGSINGGTTVTISGLNFTGATGVTFGGTAATNVTVVNDTTITATTPAHAAGLVNVAVMSPNGTGLGLGLFTYLPTAQPSVLLVGPAAGSADGGTNVVITGVNFTGTLEVRFGGIAATGVTVVNDTTITATTPAHPAGIVSVDVETPNGTGLGAGLFVYLPTAQPSVLLVTPPTGSIAGGTSVTISGLNFTGATGVSFGGTAATSVTVVNDTTITATAPPHSVGVVNVSVTAPGGTGIGLGLFTYLPTAQPSVILAAPLAGPVSGGTTVTLTGFNFTGATGVSFGGTPATGVTVVNDTTIVATSPAHAVGLVDVSVISPSGTGIGLGLYTYLPTLPPSVLLAAPLAGPVTGGTSVTISGLNFTGATSVSFGGVAATGVTVVNDSTITATAPAHPAGLVNVSVSSPTGTGLGLGLYTYLPTLPPSVLLVTPPAGAIGGGTPVTITGLNFTGATGVTFGGTAATGVTVVNDTTISAIAPAHAAGIVDVAVTSSTNGSGVGLGLFTYLPTAPPSVLLVAPLTGSTAGGTPVTITGLNFTGAIDVDFGGTPATGVTVVNDNTITATAPAHAVGIVDVSVTSPEGTGLGLGLFTYLPTLPPSVVLVAPLTGSTTGGTPVTITGVNFTGATAVDFGGTPATGVTVINDTTISATAPAHAAGIVDVSVTSPAGPGLGLGLFTYLPTVPPSVLLATPLTGTASGGTTVTLTGLNLTGATDVSFGGTPATNVVVVNDTTVTATAPAHAAGIVNVSVTTPAGTGLGLGLFTYLPILPPSAILVTPLTGSTAGGTAVTITGLDFTGATGVSFGATPATNVIVVNDNTITATAPAHAAGLVNVSVESGAGTGIGTGVFTYVPTLPPSVVLATPLTGSTAGGTPVTLTGLNFTGATAVSFGGTPATNVTVVNDTTITATAPAHAAGLVNVSVTSPAGTGLGLGLFTYLPSLPPSVALVAPLTGTSSGGTQVTLVGLNFTGATAVSFGGTPATNVTVVNDTTITATNPAHAAGIVNVSVTSPQGTGLGLGLFTYLPTLPPSVVLASPLTGPTTGGTQVTLTGLNFTGATAVSFGGTPATNIAVVNDSTITATAPAHAAGIVNVSVTSPSGTGLGLGLFTYLPTAQPVVLLATPLTGPIGGGTLVTISGVNFTGATAVNFGGTPATGVTVVNDNTITAIAPAHAAGIVDVSVTTPAGSGLGLGLFTYLPALPPVVIAALPATGSTAGGTPVTITGINLTGATGVLFGGTAATNITVVSDTTITATAPAHGVGIVDVSITTAQGTGIGIGIYAYVPAAPPTVVLVTPPTGSTVGGTAVTITGFNFTGATGVSFGGTPATSVTVVNDNTITAVSPAHAVGVVDVSVTSTLGTGIGLGLFAYVPDLPPSVVAVTPLTGSTAGGTSVTLTGLNFTGATDVSFGGTPATNVTIVNNTTITATSPAHAAGVVNVSVTSPAGTGLGLGLFTYLPTLPPSVFLVSPLTGSTTGGTSVTLTGLNFTGATAVSFGGAPATNVTVVNDTTITATTPAHAAGIVNVSVSSTAGTGLGLGLFTYVPTLPPSVLLVTPLTGSTTGGTSVTLTGLNFTGATSVSFGGTPATGVTVINDTTIVATAPPHAAGVVNVSVTSPAGTGLGLGLFTYVPTLPPVVALVTPVSGSAAGGTAVTITGLNFTGATAVSFGGTPASNVAVVNDTIITATTPAHAVGVVNVSVTSLDGAGIGIGLFTYLPPTGPVILSLSPASGPTAGGNSVTISGINLTGTTAVTFGGVAASGVTVVNDTTVTVVAPAGSAGTVNVALTAAGQTFTASNAYTYLAAPIANAVAVTVPGNAVGFPIPLNITGGPAASVAVDTPPSQGIATASGTSISYTPVPGYSGPDSFTYTATNVSGTSAPATVSITVTPNTLALSPAGGELPAGNIGSVYPGATITASNGAAPFTYAVTAGTLPVGLTLNAGTGTISGTPTIAGLSSFTITATDAASATVSGAYTINIGASALPTVATVAPAWDTTAGGATVTITGTNLSGATAVTFGGTAATNLVVVNATAVTVTAPAHAAGAVDVVVITPAGSAVGTGLFSYIEPVRPDPSLDPEVIGLVNAQAASATRLARNQIRNFQSRLERLHNERERRAASMDIRIGTPSEREKDPIERLMDRQNDPRGDAMVRAPQSSASDTYGYGTGKTGPVSSAAGGGAGAGGGSDEGEEFSRLAFWSGGFVNFGDRDDEGLDIGHTTIGISGGFDYRFSEKLVAGLGIGYGRDQADIGDNGTENRAQSFSAALYASYEPIDNFFLDTLLGAGTLNFDSKRYVTSTGDIATGERSGSQVFGSVTAAYEIREESWLVSPYARVEFSRSWLDGFTEQGGGIYSLTYGSQTVDTLSGVIGVRANKSFEMDWGTLTPGLRLEYVHDFDGSSKVKLGYADLGTLPYEIDGRETDQDYVTLGLSVNMQFENDWDLTLDYRAMFGEDGNADHTVGAQLRVKF